MELENLPKRLVALRILNGKTQKEVAEAIGSNVNAYQKYEYGVRQPGLIFIVRLAKLYNVTTDYILGLNLSKKINKSFLKKSVDTAKKL